MAILGFILDLIPDSFPTGGGGASTPELFARGGSGHGSWVWDWRTPAILGGIFLVLAAIPSRTARGRRSNLGSLVWGIGLLIFAVILGVNHWRF